MSYKILIFQTISLRAISLVMCAEHLPEPTATRWENLSLQTRASSGFWALDPAGDIKMLFTPNMHKLLSPITEDEKLQKLLGQVDESVEAYKAVNH